MASLSLYRLEDVDIGNDASVSAAFREERRKPKEIDLRQGVDARLFLMVGGGKPPDWALYVNQLTQEPLGVPRRTSVGAVLLIPVDRRKRVVFAATWGAGHLLLRPERCAPDLGLRTALNLIAATGRRRRDWDPERIRALRTKRVGPTTLISQIQASRRSTVETFPIRIDADQLRQVTGVPVDQARWGLTVTGGVSLHVKRPERAAEVVAICREIDEIYGQRTYRQFFAWVDNVAPVSNPALLQDVLQDLVESIKVGDLETISFSPPDLIDWGRIDRLEYRFGRVSVTCEEPSIETLSDFLSEHSLMNDASDDLLRRVKLDAIDGDDQRIASWSALDCLGWEATSAGGQYILDEGVLFAVDKMFLDGVNKFVDDLPALGVSLPKTKKGEKEGPYNKRVATTLPGALLLDKRTVRRSGATAIEVCDVALAGGRLVHVKKGTSSSSLSHLFSQGVVSADLLHMDTDFGAAVSKLLDDDLEGTGSADKTPFGWLCASPFATSECEVAFVVMTGRRPGKPSSDLPFFSKVNLRHHCEDLRRMGFRYSLTLVPMA